VLPCFIAAQQPGLVEVIPPGQVLSEDLWLVTHADLIASARIKAVAEFLMAILVRANMS
jgi:DNA-binding transcriptional LysR family regulator